MSPLDLPDRDPTWIDDRKVTYGVRFMYWQLLEGDPVQHNFQREVWSEASQSWLQQQTVFCRDGVAARREVRRHIKFLHNYWTELVLDRHDARNVRVDGVHYQIGSETDVFKGYNGRKWKIDWLDPSRGSITVTNLWLQGEIPPCFKDALPNNAAFGQPDAQVRRTEHE